MSKRNDFRNPIRIAVESEATVLITGPTGTGKTRLARQIHERGSRAVKPFVTVNLASLHEGTIESELFGHEKGSFTGAESKRVGRLEYAQGGTVFLDEVGELSPRLQARLLEFLQSRTITPVGGSREVRLDVRIIAATHRDLTKSVAKGEFREDLFHRLRVVTVELKSLIERPDEFDALVHRCLEEASVASKKEVLRISEEVANRLESHDWPGNIRELRNVLEFAVLASSEGVIRIEDLPSWFTEAKVVSVSGADARPLGVAEVPITLDYRGSLAKFEREYLDRALRHFRGRINQTARETGINKTTLIRRMRVYGLEKNEAVAKRSG